MWPITVSHKIDVSSPLYDFGPQQLADGMMEVKIIVMIFFCAAWNISAVLASFHLKVVVSVVGEHGSGASIDSRTSYIGDEIVWGARYTRPIYNHSQLIAPQVRPQ